MCLDTYWGHNLTILTCTNWSLDPLSIHLTSDSVITCVDKMSPWVVGTIVTGSVKKWDTSWLWTNAWNDSNNGSEFFDDSNNNWMGKLAQWQATFTWITTEERTPLCTICTSESLMHLQSPMLQLMLHPTQWATVPLTRIQWRTQSKDQRPGYIDEKVWAEGGQFVHAQWYASDWVERVKHPFLKLRNVVAIQV